MIEGHDEARKRVIELLDEKVALYKLIKQAKEALIDAKVRIKIGDTCYVNQEEAIVAIESLEKEGL